VENHPVDAEPILHLPKAGGKERLLYRHQDATAVGKRGENALRLYVAIHSQCQVSAAHRLGVWDVRRHQLIIANRNARVQHCVLPFWADPALVAVKEKTLTRSRDALAAERRRMPWLAVDKKYEFDGPKGKLSLLDLFEGRRQLVVYRAFFEPGVFGWPEHACRGCSFLADQLAHLAHLNARDTTLAFASRAPQADIERLKARMGWEMPWYTVTDSFDTDFGVTTRSSTTASVCFARTSSTTAVTRRWGAPGAILI
jgi:hypothetical protein